MSTQQQLTDRALNVLAKWRAHFAGWQLGTRLKGEPESDAVRDHREVTILLRAEVSALTMLLVEKGVFTDDEWLRQMQTEAEELCRRYEQRWPGARASEDGMTYDKRALPWMKGWRP